MSTFRREGRIDDAIAVVSDIFGTLQTPSPPEAAAKRYVVCEEAHLRGRLCATWSPAKLFQSHTAQLRAMLQLTCYHAMSVTSACATQTAQRS